MSDSTYLGWEENTNGFWENLTTYFVFNNNGIQVRLFTFEMSLALQIFLYKIFNFINDQVPIVLERMDFYNLCL